MKLDQMLEFGQRSSDLHIHTPIGSDGRCEIQDMKDEIAKLDLACITDHNNIIWEEEWLSFIQNLNKIRRDGLITYTLPGTEISLAHKGKTVHIVAYFVPRDGIVQDMRDRIGHVQKTLLTEINDRIIDKFDESLKKAIEYFSENEYIMNDPEKYLLSRDLVLELRWPYLIQGHDGVVGFYYTDIIKAMNFQNRKMLEDEVIDDPEQGYGTPFMIESYFHKRKSEYDPDTQGIFLANYERMPCEGAMPFLIDTADIVGIAHEKRKEFVKEFAKKGWINAIGFVDPELAKKYNLLILPGSDYHGGEFRKERIGHDERDNKLPSCLSMLKQKGYNLFS